MMRENLRSGNCLSVMDVHDGLVGASAKRWASESRSFPVGLDEVVDSLNQRHRLWPAAAPGEGRWACKVART